MNVESCTSNRYSPLLVWCSQNLVRDWTSFTSMTRSAAAAASPRAVMGIKLGFFGDVCRYARHDDAACLPRPSNVDFV
jgi:hypothetical protein